MTSLPFQTMYFPVNTGYGMLCSASSEERKTAYVILISNSFIDMKLVIFEY